MQSGTVACHACLASHFRCPTNSTIRLFVLQMLAQSALNLCLGCPALDPPLVSAADTHVQFDARTLSPIFLCAAAQEIGETCSTASKSGPPRLFGLAYRF